MGWTSPQQESVENARAWPLAMRSGAPDALQLPDLPLTRAIFTALMAAGPGALDRGWRLGPQGASYTKRVGAEQVSVRLEATSAEDATRVLTNLSPLAIDALALLMDIGPPDTQAQTRVVRVSDVVQAKGCRRWGDERRSLVQRLSETFQALRRLSTDTRGLLFDLTPIDPEQEAFVYQPGAWLRGAGPGRRELDPRLLHLDHRHNRGADVLAKKLGIHFSLLVSGDAPVVRQVAAVLRAIGAADPDLASRRGRGGRLAERFDEALLRLAEQDLFAVRYRGGDGAVWGEDRGKGRVKRWAAADLVIRRAARRSDPDSLLADWA